MVGCPACRQPRVMISVSLPRISSTRIDSAARFPARSRSSVLEGLLRMSPRLRSRPHRELESAHHRVLTSSLSTKTGTSPKSMAFFFRPVPRPPGMSASDDAPSSRPQRRRKELKVDPPPAGSSLLGEHGQRRPSPLPVLPTTGTSMTATVVRHPPARPSGAHAPHQSCSDAARGGLTESSVLYNVRAEITTLPKSRRPEGPRQGPPADRSCWRCSVPYLRSIGRARSRWNPPDEIQAIATCSTIRSSSNGAEVWCRLHRHQP